MVAMMAAAAVAKAYRAFGLLRMYLRIRCGESSCDKRVSREDPTVTPGDEGEGILQNPSNLRPLSLYLRRLVSFPVVSLFVRLLSVTCARTVL
jgi:hypothetical protein